MRRQAKSGLLRLGPGGRVQWLQVFDVIVVVCASLFVWWAALVFGRWFVL